MGLVAGQHREPGQNADQSPIARGHRGIGSRLGAGDQPFGVLCGKEIAAFHEIPIIAIEDRHPVAGLDQKIAVAGRFIKRESRTTEVGIVVDARRMPGPAGPPAVQQTLIGPDHMPANEVEGATREFDPRRTLKDDPGIRHGGDH